MSEEIKPSNVIERVETFIQRLHDLDLVCRPVHEKDRFLAHNLAGYLSDYAALDPKSLAKEGMASLCEVWINRALAAGIIKEGEGVLRQLRRMDEEREKLTRENERLVRELDKVKAELEDAKRNPFLRFAARNASDTDLSNR